MRIVALIPARAGSKRIPGKNTKLLGGKPLIQWTIEAAEESHVFDKIIVSTEDAATMQLANRCGNNVWPHARLRAHASDTSADIDWVRDLFTSAAIDGRAADHEFEAFAILRPTSPFRTADTIRRAIKQFKEGKCSSLRAVERVKQHPGKMWQRNLGARTIEPLIDGPWIDPVARAPFHPTGAPWHSQPTQSLPTVYVQNSSLEIAHRWCVDIFDSISGPKVAPFFTEGYEGFAIDYPEDWARAEQIVADLQAPPAA